MDVPTKLVSTVFFRLNKAWSSSFASSYFCLVTCGGSVGAAGACELDEGTAVVFVVAVFDDDTDGSEDFVLVCFGDVDCSFYNII